MCVCVCVCVFSLQMFLSIGFAAGGVVGAIYSLSVSALGLANGPSCLYEDPVSGLQTWGTPFANRYRPSLWTDIISSHLST